MIEQAIEMLNEQQSKVKERSAPWMVAEQLKDICRREPESAELLAKDLENPQMGIVQAEKKIKSFADGHKTGGFSCVTPLEAEEILREFYGLGAASASVGGDTNADRIRAMSDQELAAFLSGVCYGRDEPWERAFKAACCDCCPTVKGTDEYGRRYNLHECDFEDGVCPHGDSILWWLVRPQQVE